MLTVYEQVAFVILVIGSLYLTWNSFSKMVQVIGRGQGRLYLENLGKRIYEAVIVVISQKTVLKERFSVSILHLLLAWAFILYFLVNPGDVLEGFIPGFTFLGHGVIGNYYRLFVDVFSVLALISMSFFLIRRFIFGSKLLLIRDNVKVYDSASKGMRKDSLIVGLFILAHIGFRFLGAGFRIAAEGADVWQPFASGVSLLWTGMSPQTLQLMEHLCWWIALGLILAFLPYFPYSKHAHLFMGPINFLTRPQRSSYGTMEKLDFENEEIEQFGASHLEHLDKTSLIDAYACIMCNRCQDACPAYQTGKELSPSALEVNKRYYINNNINTILSENGSANPLLEFALSESALWACTTCAACVDVCPVGNEPMFDLLNIRRDRVLMESQFPKELQNAFNGIERNQNPWNINDDRLKWAKEDETLEVKTVEENPDFEILYWVGCAGAFDQKGQNIARSFTKILNKADVNFAVLGNKESCTGDSARRAGNEYLFAMMADENVQTLNNAKVKKIVTTCPHCLHTLKNEYPQFGGNFEVIHHTELIDTLISENKLKLENKTTVKATFHDPCYLGRHNNVYDAPRDDLKALGIDVVEMERNKNNSFCCGAGGAQMWKEEEKGDEPIRQNRFKEAQQTGAEIVCTSCPFCLTMMRDAGNELDSNIAVKDIAEIIAEQL
jgi:Fe-S oxidoreductase